MRSDGIAFSQPPSRVFGSTVWTSTARPEPAPPVCVLRGRDAVLSMQPALVELSHRTGQRGAMEWLDHSIASPDSVKKTPYLVLVGSREPATAGFLSHAALATELTGALFLYEYRLCHLGMRVFATDDIYGTQTVIAPVESRLQIAQLAARHLTRLNAAMVFASVDCGHDVPHEKHLPPAPADVRIALRVRAIPDTLKLQTTLEATLSMLGPTTRRNLRRYQRRAATELDVQFIPHARPSLKEYLALNRAATHPLSLDAALWRYRLRERSAADPATLWAGLRTSGGRWVSLIWGRRNEGTTMVLSQTNLTGLPRHSLTTAMRSFLLEHEIALGTKQIQFVGGTPHSMRSCFTDSFVADLLAVRSNSVRARLLSSFAFRLLPQANFLRGALQDENICWAPAAA